MISFSVAVDPCYGIGIKGSLPWHIKEELQLFRRNTLYKNIVMGQTTYDNLPGKLKDRFITVVSIDPDYHPEGVEVTHDLIAFLDADDLYAPEKLEKQVQYMEAHPDCRIVFTGLKNFLDESVVHPDSRIIRLLCHPVPAALPSALICRDVFDQAGLFNEAYARGEDTDWLLRVSAAGISTSHVMPEVLYLRRIHETNTTGDTVDKQALLRMVRQAAMMKKNRNQEQ